MIWLIGTLCFAVGLCSGAVLFRQFKSDTTKIRALQEQLANTQSEYASYREEVNTHFHTSSRLFSSLGQNYRELYRHMADSANALCPEDVPGQLSLSNLDSERLFPEADMDAEPHKQEIAPPLDYAQKSDPGQKGNLSEDYGLDER
ncbi:MAG: DUF1043 family protein [Pseudomonadales bacterium]|nr:DUF1043 family protein [Pseudomonadales bacterium]